MLEVEPLVELAHRMLREAESAGGLLSSEAVAVLVAAEQRVREVARGEPVTAAPRSSARSGSCRRAPWRRLCSACASASRRRSRSKLTASERAQLSEASLSRMAEAILAQIDAQAPTIGSRAR